MDLEERTKLFNDNVKLAYKANFNFLRRYKWTRNIKKWLREEGPQESALIMWKSLKTFDKDKGKLSSYIYYAVFRGLKRKINQMTSGNVRGKGTKRFIVNLFYVTADGLTKNDQVGVQREPSQLELFDHVIDYQKLWKSIKGMGKREHEMIELYYKDNLTLQAIATRYGVSRERVRQIISKTLIELQYWLDPDQYLPYEV